MDRKIAIKLLNDNYQKNVCLIENLTHDDVEFINVGNNAVCFKLIPSGLTMFSKIASGDILVDNLKNNWRCGMTTDADSAQFISSALGLKVKECIQVIYNKLPTIEIDGLNIEKLSCNEEIAKTIAKNYTLNYSVSAVYNLLKYRFMFGAYYNGELAGFIGMPRMNIFDANLVKNGDFSDGLSGWSMRAPGEGATVTLNKTEGVNGSACAYVDKA